MKAYHENHSLTHLCALLEVIRSPSGDVVFAVDDLFGNAWLGKPWNHPGAQETSEKIQKNKKCFSKA